MICNLHNWYRPIAEELAKQFPITIEGPTPECPPEWRAKTFSIRSEAQNLETFWQEYQTAELIKLKEEYPIGTKLAWRFFDRCFSGTVDGYDFGGFLKIGCYLMMASDVKDYGVPLEDAQPEGGKP